MKYLIAFLITFTSSAKQVINVGLEIAPPLITKDGMGVLNKILEEVEKSTPYKFKYQYMTYGRAQRELRKGGIQIMGITPVGKELPEFYQYAQDLEWSFKSYNLLFHRKEDSLKKDLFEFTTIGTLPGNEDFMMSLYNLPRERFNPGNLNSLFRMLKRKRIDGILFESISSMSVLKNLDFKNIKARKASHVYGGFAARKSNQKLIHHLNKAFARIDTTQFFGPLTEYQELDNIPFININGRSLKK